MITNLIASIVLLGAASCLSQINTKDIDFEATRKAYDEMFQKKGPIALGVIVYKKQPDNKVEIALPATVSTTATTNVVSGDNSTKCSCFENWQGLHWEGDQIIHQCTTARSATEKWETTSIVKTVTVALEWNGEPITHKKETVISSSTKRWKLTSEWKEDSEKVEGHPVGLLRADTTLYITNQIYDGGVVTDK